MSCDERAELLLLLAAGALDEAAPTDLHAHLDTGCPRCAGAWVEAQATLALAALDLPPATPAHDVRDRLLARADADVAAARSPLRRPPQAGLWLRPGLAAGLAAVITYFAVTIPLNRRHAVTETLVAEQTAEIADLRETLDASRVLSTRQAALQQTVEHQRAEIARLEGEVADALQDLGDRPVPDRLVTEHRDQVRRLENEIARLKRESADSRQLALTLGSPDVQVVTLAGTGPGEGASGRIFWDRASGLWHFYAARLPESAPGRTYALWFITSADTKIPAGLFDVDAFGNATAVIRVPPSIGGIALAAVTDEPAGGMPHPTGSIHLAGRVPLPGRDS